MSKERIVFEISKETLLPQAAINKVIDILFDKIEKSLANGEKIQFSGFGTFEPKKRAARIGRNPHTKEAVPIPARVIPSFKPSKKLMSKVSYEIK